MSDTAARLLPDDDTEAFIAAVKEGLVDAEAGRTLIYEDVRRWMLSWGTEREQSPPECP